MVVSLSVVGNARGRGVHISLLLLEIDDCLSFMIIPMDNQYHLVSCLVCNAEIRTKKLWLGWNKGKKRRNGLK